MQDQYCRLEDPIPQSAPPPYQFNNPNPTRPSRVLRPVDSKNAAIAKLINGLPLKTWEQVTQHLAFPQQAMLALASKQLYAHLPKEYLRVRKTDTTWIELLLLLDRDLPEYRLCLTCRSFHPRRPSQQPVGTCQELAIRLSKHTSYPWAKIQLAMRALHYGKLHYGVSIDELTTTWTKVGWNYNLRGIVSHDQYLLLIIRASRPYSQLKNWQPASKQYLENKALEGLPICHCDTDMAATLSSVTKCRLSHNSLESLSRCTCQQNVLCTSCLSVWRVRLEKSEERGGSTTNGIVLVVDRMTNAGPLDLVARPEQFSHVLHRAYEGRVRPRLSASEQKPATLTTRERLLRRWNAFGKRVFQVGT